MTLRMAADCSYLRLSTAFPTVRLPYCSADSSRLLILLLVNGFPNGLRANFVSGWQCIAGSSARQWLSWFAHHFAWRMRMYSSFFRSSTAFTVCVPYFSMDGSRMLVLPLVNGFLSLRAVLLSG